MTFAPTCERMSLCLPDVTGDEILGPAIGTKDDVDNDLAEGSNLFAVVLFLNLSRSGFAPPCERISLCPTDVAGDEILGPAIGATDDVDNDLVEKSNFLAVVLFLNLSRNG